MQEEKLTFTYVHCHSRGALYAGLIQYDIERMAKCSLPQQAESLNIVPQLEEIEKEIHQNFKRFEL